MRKTICYLLVVFFGCFASSMAQDATVKNVQQLPRVVAKFEKLNQTKGIKLANIFTPQASGVYRVTYLLFITQGSGKSGSYLLGSVNNTGGLGPTGPPIRVPLDLPNSVTQEFPTLMQAGDPLTLTLYTYYDFSLPYMYDIFVVVEQIM
jgi:hypothetical protein